MGKYINNDYEMRLFFAFSSTSVWVVVAFVVQNEQQRKTFTNISYDVQKNTVASIFFACVVLVFTNNIARDQPFHTKEI